MDLFSFRGTVCTFSYFLISRSRHSAAVFVASPQMVTTHETRKSPKVSLSTGSPCVKLIIREVRALMFSMFDISVESTLLSTVKGGRNVKISRRC